MMRQTDPKPLSACWFMALVTAAGCVALTRSALGQGCIAVRGGGQCSLSGHLALEHDDSYLNADNWQVSLNYRWIHSDRTFIGDQEFKIPKERGAEAVNDSHYIDLSVQYAISSRFSLGLTLPFFYGTRSTTYEHDNV